MKRCAPAVALLLAVLATPAGAADRLARLTVDVDGLEPPTGRVEVSLFETAESFMKKPYLQQVQAIDGQTRLQFEFAGIAPGDYAIVVVHDENDNGLYDAGFLGFGGEGLGYSNDARPLLGRPSFDAAHFTVEGEDLTVTIHVR